MEINRRSFLRKSGLAFLGIFALKNVFADETNISFLSNDIKEVGYGALIKDPNKIIDLPRDFSYKIISRAGGKMTDGFYVPAYPDGMGAFPGPDGLTIILRNHEVWPGLPPSFGAFGKRNRLLKRLREDLIYDKGRSDNRCLGGTTTLVFDTRSQQLKSQFLCLAGTLANCSGGVTPWNSWLAAEETFEEAGKIYNKDHGYIFEVPVSVEPRIAKPLPLKALGHFVHEGVAVEPDRSIVYQTEDQHDSLLYRFIPNKAEHLSEGGRLQCLAVDDMPQFDTRNWGKQRVSPGEILTVRWLDLDDVDPDQDNLRYQGYKKGAAIFARGEGLCFSDGVVYFDCTIGGRTATGQIWRYILSPFEGTGRENESPGKLELFIELNDRKILENPDQLTMAPWGDLLVCEDGEGKQYLLGITPQRKIYRFARNASSDSEFSGTTFSPDGSTMFLNDLKSGLTLAITGSWKHSSEIG
jgi:secreted PhoX family phosphatase